MTTYAERKARVYERLAVYQRTFARAAPDSLNWTWWSRVLELVEQLPRGEQERWKARHMATLRRAVRMPEKVRS